MPSLILTAFGGRVPRRHEKLLEQYQAQTADNVDLREGNLKALLDVTEESDLGAGTPKTLWKYASTLTAAFGNDIQAIVVDSAIQESNDRFMYTGDGYPKQSDSALWSGTKRRLGVVAPTSAPTITIQGAAGTDTQDIVSYCYTMVTSWGEESAPSPVTAVTTVTDGQYIELSDLDTPAGTGCDYEFKNIYRLSSGTAGAEYMYLDQIAEAETTYDDDGGGGELADVSEDAIETTDWDACPATLAGLTQAHNGMLLGYVEKEMYVSEPFIPYAMDADKTLTFDTDITGIGAGHEFIVVVSSKFPYIITGSDPETLIPVKQEINSKCTSQRGFVSSSRGLFYPAPDGLAHCDGSTVKIVTKDYITKEQWDTLTSVGDIIGEWYNEKYYAFFEGTNDGMIIDIDKGEITTFSILTANDAIRDVYHDASDDTLYVLVYDGTSDSLIYSFETDSTYLTYTWKSKKFPDPHRYNCAKIKGDFTVAGTELEFKYLLDGTAVQTKKIFVQDAQPTADQAGDWWFDSNDSYTAYRYTGSAWVADTQVRQNGMFRLTNDPGATEKEIQLSGDIEVDSIQLATSPSELI